MNLKDIANKVASAAARNSGSGISTGYDMGRNSGISRLFNAVSNVLRNNNGTIVRNYDGNFHYDTTQAKPAGRFVPYKEKIWRFLEGNEWGSQSPQDTVSEEAIFVDGFDDPTSLTFKVEFGEWGASLNDMKTTAAIQRSAIDTNAYLMVYDNMPMGLLDLNFIAPEDMTSLFAGQTTYNAYNYLLNRNEDRRAQYAKDFIEGLYVIQRDMPYIFHKISGLDKLGDFDALRGQRLKDAQLRIECLPDGLDWKMRHLMELYRKFTWDDQYQRWVLPDIYRFFKMIIYIYDKRVLNGRWGEMDYSEDYLPVLALECGPCEFVIKNSWDSDFTQDYMQANTNAPSLEIKVHNVKTYYANTLMNRVKYIKDIMTHNDHRWANDAFAAQSNGKALSWQFEWLRMNLMHNDEYRAYHSDDYYHFVGDDWDYDTDYMNGETLEKPMSSWHQATVTDTPYIVRNLKDLKQWVKGIIFSNTKLIRDSRQPDQYYFTNDLMRISPEMMDYYYKRNWVHMDEGKINKELAARLKEMLKQMKDLAIVGEKVKHSNFQKINDNVKIPKQNFTKLPDSSYSPTMADVSLYDSSAPDMDFLKMNPEVKPGDMAFNKMNLDTSLPDQEYARLFDSSVGTMDFLQMDPKDASYQMNRFSLIETEPQDMDFLKMYIDDKHNLLTFLRMGPFAEIPDLEYLQMITDLEKVAMDFLQMGPFAEIPDQEFLQMIFNEKGHMEFLQMLPALDKVLMDFLRMIPNEKGTMTFMQMIQDVHHAIMEFLQLIPNEKGDMEFLQMLPDLEKVVMDFLQMIPAIDKAILPWLRMIPDYRKARLDFLELVDNLEKSLQQYAQLNIDTSKPEMEYLKLVDNIQKMKQQFAEMLVDLSKAQVQYLKMNPDTSTPDMSMQQMEVIDTERAMQMTDMIIDEYVQHSQMVTPISDIVKAHTNLVEMAPDDVKIQQDIQVSMAEAETPRHSEFVQMNMDISVAHSQMPEMVESEAPRHSEFVKMDPYTEIQHSQMPEMVVDTSVAHSQMLEMVIDEMKKHRDFVKMNIDTSVAHSQMPEMVVDTSLAHSQMSQMITDVSVAHSQMPSMIENETPRHSDMIQMIESETPEHSQLVQMVPDDEKVQRDIQLSIAEAETPRHSEFVQMDQYTEIQHSQMPEMIVDTEIQHSQMPNMIIDTSVSHSQLVEMAPDYGKGDMEFVRPELTEKMTQELKPITLVDNEKQESADLVQMNIAEDSSLEMKRVRLEIPEYNPNFSMTEMLQNDVSVSLSDVSLVSAGKVEHQPMIHMKGDEEVRHSEFVEMQTDSSIVHSQFSNMVESDVSVKMSSVKIEEPERVSDDNIKVRMDESSETASFTNKEPRDVSAALAGAKIQFSPKLQQKIEDLAMIDPGSLKEQSTETLVRLIDLLENTLNEAKREVKMQYPKIVENSLHGKIKDPGLETAEPNAIRTMKKEIKMPDLLAMDRAERMKWDKNKKKNPYE